MPMIQDSAYLMSESEISKIYNKNYDENYVIGYMIKEGLPVSLPWERIFNTHIGIFGNTGSGKSNTLAKLYTTLFDNKKDEIANKSKFVFIDFNGEYTNNQLLNIENKTIFNLSTRDYEGDKFPIRPSEFWDSETLSILFKATENTQKPFIKRMVEGRRKFGALPGRLSSHLRASIKRIFASTSQKRESIDLIKRVLEILGEDETVNTLNQLSWHSGSSCFYFPGDANSYPIFFNGDEATFNTYIKPKIDNLEAQYFDEFDELLIRINLALSNELQSGHVQFEHIQPLLKRAEGAITSLKKVISVVNESKNPEMLDVISFRRCDQETKKVLPLLIAKHFFEDHKKRSSSPPNKTLHYVIDEAHNILSQQSSREQESWRDYRLELFEEIIKEGRKFGVFLTLSSQRPSDISATIMSQLHNFFIHRLVNDRDLMLLESTVNTLDFLSKNMIPQLPKGACIITGTSFDLPLLIQIRQLDVELQPDSDDVNLEKLWGK